MDLILKAIVTKCPDFLQMFLKYLKCIDGRGAT